MPKKTFFNLPEEKRRNIIDIALEEFAANGYSKTSINSIVSRADIAKGSVYQYFNDKKDFYLYLVKYVKDLYVEHRLSEVGDIYSQPMRISLKRIILFFRIFIDRYPNEVRFYFALVGDTSIPFDEDIARIMTDPSLKYVRDIIETGKARGELRRDIDENLLAFELVALITSFQQISVNPAMAGLYGMINDDIEGLSLCADRLLDLIFDGISVS